MKYKNQLFAITIISLLLLSAVASVFAVDEELVGETKSMYYSDITINSDGTNAYLVEEDVKTPNIFIRSLKNLFGFKESFLTSQSSDVAQGSYQCSYIKSAGSYIHRPYKDLNVGGQCPQGSYIVFKSDGGEIPRGKIIFDDVWYKSTTTTVDLPNFKNHYTNPLEFTYSYNCYSCNIQNVETNEKSCLTADESECVVASSSECKSIDYVFESTCLAHIKKDCLVGTGPLQPNQDYCPPPKETDITLYDIQVTNNGNLVEGQNFEITGKARIEGVCDGCVIETSFGEYKQKFSTLTSTGGACGDDKTSGIKFNVQDKTIIFKLKDKATTSGKFKIPIYATNGCYDDLGSQTKLLDTKLITVDVDEQYIPPELTTCYTCERTTLQTKEVDGSCNDYGFDSNTIDCSDESDEQITCYYCAGDSLRSSLMNGNTCPDGQSDTQLSCESQTNEITCYYCAGDNLRTTLIDGDECVSGTFATEQDCTQPGDDCGTDGSSCEPQPCVGEECNVNPGNGSGNPIVIIPDEELETSTKVLIGIGVLVFLGVLLFILNYSGVKKK